MNKLKNKFLSVVLSAVMAAGMFTPMAAQAAFITSGDEFIKTENGLGVKLTAVIDGSNDAYAADIYGDKSSTDGNFADVFDGNASTGIIYRTDRTSWDGYIQKDDYIQIDFEEAIDMNGIDFTFICPPVANGSSEDGFRNATLEYTTDGENWTVLETFTGVVKAVDFNAPETISGVTAVRLVNKLEERFRVWVRLAEIAVDGVVAEVRPEVCEVFPDVIHAEWYEEAVQYVYDNGIMSGSNGLFKPEDSVTRAQVVATLYNLEGTPAVDDYQAVDALKDVRADQWYTDAVCWAYNTGVAKGSSATKFGVKANITRQQLAVMLYNYAVIKGYATDVRGDYSDLQGADEVADYAVEAMQWAFGTGLISGSNGALKPTGDTTRAQMASILKNFVSIN